MSAPDTSLWSLIHQLSCSDVLSMHDSSSIVILKTIIRNGPMSVFEMSSFEAGTKELMDTVVTVTAAGVITVIGGSAFEGSLYDV